MKCQAIQYLALDLHKATTTATARDEAGKVRMRMTVRTTAWDLLSVARAAGVHVAIEEGTQAQWVHDVPRPHAERVVVWRPSLTWPDQYASPSEDRDGNVASWVPLSNEHVLQQFC